MRKIASIYTLNSGGKKSILVPTNGKEMAEGLKQSAVYTFFYKLGMGQGQVTGMYEGHTDYYKSLLVRDLSRKNRSGEYVQMCIPTENIHHISDGMV